MLGRIGGSDRSSVLDCILGIVLLVVLLSDILSRVLSWSRWVQNLGHISQSRCDRSLITHFKIGQGDGFDLVLTTH